MCYGLLYFFCDDCLYVLFVSDLYTRLVSLSLGLSMSAVLRWPFLWRLPSTVVVVVVESLVLIFFVLRSILSKLFCPIHKAL